MNKYEIRTNKKKEAIIKASLELFQKNGFINTNIKNIASLAKVSQVSIYNYFGSKNGLVKEAISFLMDSMISSSNDILSLTIPFQERVQKALSLCTDEFDSAIKEYFSVAALEDPQMVQAIMGTLNGKKTDLYRRYIEAGKAEGCINKAIPTETILDYLNSISTLENSPKYIDEKYREDILKLMLNGIFITN